MRLWSLHPRYLDRRGLVALWREGLLAQAVLRGRTRGYRHHPQLARFQATARPVAAIADYLRVVQEEATRRGYSFDRSKLARGGQATRLRMTRGQLAFEWEHLIAKVRKRDPEWLGSLPSARPPRAHPAFRVVAGGIAEWEKGR